MPETDYRAVYPKLSNFYFVYFALFGALIPYASLYYQSLSFDAIQIGQLMAVFVGTKIIAPNLLGWLADISAQTIRWLRWSAFLTLIASIGFVVTEAFWGLLLTVFGFSFFFHAALPLFESYTFTRLSGLKERYGQVRLWGSIGFIAATLGVGWQIELWGLSIFPWVLVGLAGLTWLSTFWVKEVARPEITHFQGGFKAILTQPWVLALLSVSVLIQFSHGTYYSFYSIYLTDAGYDKTTIAWLWALGVIAEVAVFFWMAPLFRRFNVAYLLVLSLWLTLIRWIMIPWFPDVVSLLMAAQLLHAASYGLFHAAAIYLIDHHFQGANQSRGQALYASASHGFGGALGMLAAGYGWYAGGAGLAFGISVVSVLLALWIAHRWVQRF